ncbi:MAG: hypothetical protein ACXVHT_05140 [Methanobacterium sp.]
MGNKREVIEAEKLLQIQESIIYTLKHGKNVEKEYLSTVKKLLDYWKNKLDNLDSQDKNRDKVLEKVKSEEAIIKKIKKDMHDIDELIEKYEKDLEKK